MFAPAHPRLAFDDIDDAFQVTMMMCAGLGVRPDGHGAGPQFLRADPREIDRGLAVHPRPRRHVGVKLVSRNDANTIMLPALRIIDIARVAGMNMIVRTCHVFTFRKFCREIFELLCFQGRVLGRLINQENSMGSMTDKIKGATNEAAGKAKQGAGEAVGSDRMKGEGAAQELKGKGQKAVGDAKQAAKDVANDAADAANKNL